MFNLCRSNSSVDVWNWWQTYHWCWHFIMVANYDGIQLKYIVVVCMCIVYSLLGLNTRKNVLPSILLNRFVFCCSFLNSHYLELVAFTWLASTARTQNTIVSNHHIVQSRICICERDNFCSTMNENNSFQLWQICFWYATAVVHGFKHRQGSEIDSKGDRMLEKDRQITIYGT